jgi:hypothetical protein
MTATQTFRVGDRVTMRDAYDRKTYHGEIVASPGSVFNGWCVRLDNGIHRGVYSDGLRHE